MPPDDITVQFEDGKTLKLRPTEPVSPSFYVNNASFGMTQWDIAIDLSEITGIIPGENPEEPIALINRKVRLVMTPAYAKTFASTLLRHVAKRELLEKGAPKEQEPSPAAEPAKAERVTRKRTIHK